MGTVMASRYLAFRSPECTAWVLMLGALRFLLRLVFMSVSSFLAHLELHDRR
jgi:hypothetical protein